MPLLTPEQLAEIQEILRRASTAVAITTAGYEVPKEELDRLVRDGYLTEEQARNLVLDSWQFGQLAVKLPAVKQWSYGQFQKEVAKNPPPLSVAEKNAVEVAKTRAGMFCQGLGNRFSDAFHTQVVAIDEQLAAKTRETIATAVSEKIARRQSVKELKTQLGRLTGDWRRDWDRIAATESHLAHQEGFFQATVAKHGSEELLAKMPNPNACDECKRLYLGPDGNPIIKPASWWEKQGVSNVGRKREDWKPVLGAVHPHCFCELLRVPQGWGFNEDMELVPSPAKKSSVSESDKLEKARKLHYRTTFQGFPISIENKKGAIRRWYDPHTDTEGETKMQCPYGYIRLSEGADGDHVDVFLGPDESAEKVYVVHQMKAPSFKEFDEDKCLLGFKSAKAAKAAYLQHFDRPDFFGGMSTFTVEEFRRKLETRRGEMIKHEHAELARWEKAITAVGIPADRFHLVVKYAGMGHPESREALDLVYAELRKANAGEVFPHDRTVGHMSLQSPQPPRRKPTPQVHPEWATVKDRKPRKKRKRVNMGDKPVDNPQDPNEIVTPQSRFDFRSGPDAGQSNPPHLDRVETLTKVEDRSAGVAATREGIASQVEQRRKLNESAKLDSEEIREIYRQ